MLNIYIGKQLFFSRKILLQSINIFFFNFHLIFLLQESPKEKTTVGTEPGCSKTDEDKNVEFILVKPEVDSYQDDGVSFNFLLIVIKIY